MAITINSLLLLLHHIDFSASCYVSSLPLPGTSPQITSLALSHLGSATSLSSPNCTIGTDRSEGQNLTFYRSIFSFVDCRSLRNLAENQLTGTIPPQLRNLFYLYVADSYSMDFTLSPCARSFVRGRSQEPRLESTFWHHPT